MKRIALAVLLLTAIAARAGVNRWTVIGPPASMRVMAVDPYDSDTIHAAGVDVVARSEDRGATWTLTTVSGLGSADVLRIAPSVPSTLYVVGSGGLHRSTNGGVSWTHRNVPKTAQFQRDLQVSVNDSDALVVGASNFCFFECTGGGVFRSDNGGSSWRSLGLSDQDVTAVALDPSSAQTVYAITGSKLMKTTNDGRSWRNVSPSNDVQSVAVDAVIPTTIYAGTQSGVFRSVDAGASWELIRASAFSSSVAAAQFRSRDLFAVADGLLVSVDQGQSWLELSTASSGLDFRGLRQIVPGAAGRYYMISDLLLAPGQILEYEVRQQRRRGVRK